MQMPTKLAILFNGAALLIVAASGVAAFRSIFIPEEIASCGSRYQRGTQLSLERSPGDMLMPADLQARFGGRDWGLLENASIVSRKDSPTGHAIEVRLARATAESTQTVEHSGIGFTWQPKLVSGISAACLTYSVFMPEDFDFGKGGRLPGLLGTSDERPAGEVAFSIRHVWRDNGGLEIYGHLPQWAEGKWLPNNRGGYFFPRGRWVSLEQEVVLNTPGQPDGMLRVWADGALKFEKTGLLFRENADVRISGALVEAARNDRTTAASTGKQRTLWLSPVELRWE